MKTIDQQMKDIPYELRIMRADKLKLEGENNQLSNKKFHTIETINKNELAIVQLVNKVKKLNKDITSSELEFKQARARLIKVIKEVKDKLEEPQNMLLEAEAAQDQLKADRTELKQKEIDLERKENVFKVKQTELNQRLASLKQANEKATADNVTLKKAIASYTQKSEAIDREREEVMRNLARAKKLNVDLEAKIDKGNEAQKLLDGKIKLAESRYEDYVVAKDNYEKDFVMLKINENKANDRKLSYEKALADLGTREKQIRITELKISKGIREREIEKELKELEKKAE